MRLRNGNSNQVLRRLACHLPKSALKPAVDGIILSRVRYGLAVYGNLRKTEEDRKSQAMTKIQKALNKVLRFMIGAKVEDKVPTRKLLERSGLLSINQLVAECKLLETARAMRTNIPSLSEELKPLAETRQNLTIITRQMESGHLRMPDPRLLGKNNFLIDAVKLWNLLPLECRTNSSRPCFKRGVITLCKTLPL